MSQPTNHKLIMKHSSVDTLQKCLLFESVFDSKQNNWVNSPYAGLVFFLNEKLVVVFPKIFIVIYDPVLK